MDSDCGPVLIAAGIVLKEDIASRELRKRGFIVKHCHERNGTINFAITLSKRLTTKLAAENNLPIMAIMDYSSFEQLTLANQAVKVVERAATLKCSCWVAHDQAKRQVVDAMSNLNKDSNAALFSINSYYGPQIAMYYGFMRFYIKSLIPPMIAGILLFLHQSLNRQIDSVYLPIFCLAITLWSTFYLERWKRHCAELAYRWGVYGAEDKELTDELAKVRWTLAGWKCQLGLGAFKFAWKFDCSKRSRHFAATLTSFLLSFLPLLSRRAPARK